MNESTLTQLKILVERSVRPVRSTISRKRKMREELLAHVSAVFEEEVAKLGDERAALERTRVRFGNAAELTGELQGSVSASDSFEGSLEMFLWRPGESTLRRASRHTLGIAAPILVFLSVTWLAPGRVSRWPTRALLQGSVFLAVCLAIFGFTCLVHWLRQALYGPGGRSWFRALLAAAAAWLMLPVLVFGLYLEFSGDVWSSLKELLPTLPFYVVFPLVLGAVAHTSAAQMRDHQEWASLQID